MMMGVWENVVGFGAFEGVTGAGFSQDGDLVVVRTADGVSYVRSDDGRVISSYRGSSMEERLVDGFRGIRVLGIGGEGEEISISGYWGGGLRRMTDDGWSVEWRSVGDELEALLSSKTVKERHRIGRLGVISYLPGAGFSPCGRYLMFAMHSFMRVWKRCSK